MSDVHGIARWRRLEEVMKGDLAYPNIIYPHFENLVSLIQRGELEPSKRATAFDLAMCMCDLTLGDSQRQVNRAYFQASKLVGLPYDRFHHVLKKVRLNGVKEAAAFTSEMRLNIQLGDVYVLREVEGERFKVGFSQNVDFRIETVRRSMPFDVREAFRVPGVILNETAWQAVLRPCWLGGEWFSIDAFDERACSKAFMQERRAA
jgi:hypothetical protein